MEEPKCKICGDTGRAKPTLSEPDGEECECTKEPGIMECEPHIMRRAKIWVLRKLFVKLGYSKTLGKAFDLQIINGEQLHHLDAMFKHYKGAPDYHKSPCA